MILRDRIENILQFLTDCIFAMIPQAKPDPETLRNCKIVSHRGEHGYNDVKENTLAAFDLVLQQGIWGIEFDIRWTKDMQPVVIHDPDCERVFGVRLIISQVDLNELHSRVPQIPTLAQVIEAYGGKIHLMAEFKQESFLNIQYQRDCLRKLFASLTPEKDFHFLALNLEVFQLLDFVPRKTLLPVAVYNARKMSDIAILENYAGVIGQYMLLNNELVHRHRQGNQKIGTGFVRSRNCFYRELNRDVSWVFSNHAIKLRKLQQTILQRQFPTS